MGSFSVQPKYGGHPGGLRASDGQLYPVLNREILYPGHTPDVAGFHGLLDQNHAGGVGHPHRAVRGDLESGLVRTILFGLLGHQSDVGHRTHCGRVEGAVATTVLHDLFVHRGVTTVRYQRLGLLEPAIGIPHLAAVTHHRRHRSVDDDVARDMQVGHARGGIDHGQRRAAGIDRVDVGLYLGPFFRGQGFHFFVEVAHAHIGVDAQRRECFCVLAEDGLEEHRDGMAEQDGIRNLHHRRFQVHRKQQAGFHGFFHLIRIELAKGLHADKCAVNDFAL